MNKKMIITLSLAVALGILIVAASIFKSSDLDANTLTGTVMGYSNNILSIATNDSLIYTCDAVDMNFNIGDTVTIEYTGILNENYSLEKCSIIDYKPVLEEAPKEVEVTKDEIFGDYYPLAEKLLESMSLDEKIGQLLLVRYPNANQIETLKQYNFGGYLFFEKDFKDKTSSEVKSMISSLQAASRIPILTAVDEEGGSVVRVSSNSNLADSRFKSPSDIYGAGGFDGIREDTINKSKLLYSLGINLNLAPVVDVSTNSSDYMYNRTLKQNTELTSTFASTVINASRGLGVSYTLKHFPGYGSNADTHVGGATDNRSYEEILETDIPPFVAGIESGAEAILVSHNIVSSIDSSHPASLSTSIHKILRDDLDFTGVIITDDIAMGATKDIGDAPVQAVLSGNNLIITTDYEATFTSIKNAVESKVITEDKIDELATRVLAWKYYKSLINDNDK